MGGRRQPGITEGVENSGTVGLTEVEGSSVGCMGCGDSGTVMSAGVSVEVTGSGIIKLFNIPFLFNVRLF